MLSPASLMLSFTSSINDTSAWSIGNFLAWTALSSPTSVTWRNTLVVVLTVLESEYSHDKRGRR